MTTETGTTVTTTQVYRVWIKATPERIWAAITDPEWNNRYGYAAPSYYELKPGGSFHAQANQGMKDFAAGERIRDARHDPRRRGDRGRPAPPAGADLADADGPDNRRRTVHHADLRDRRHQHAARRLQADRDPRAGRRARHGRDGRRHRGRPAAGGGWAWILSDLKTLVETGKKFGE